jgi:outer membrane protein TolC
LGDGLVSYDNGLGNIIELLDAQIALASAREQKIEAETDWYVALADLTHDVGILTRELSPADLLNHLRP